MSSNDERTALTADTQKLQVYARIVIAMCDARSRSQGIKVAAKLAVRNLAKKFEAALNQSDPIATRQLITEATEYLAANSTQLLLDVSHVLGITFKVTERRCNAGWPEDLHVLVTNELKIVTSLKAKVNGGGLLTITDLQALCTALDTAVSTRVAARELTLALRGKRTAFQKVESRYATLTATVQQTAESLVELLAHSLAAWEDQKKTIKQLQDELLPRHRKALDALALTIVPGGIDWKEFTNEVARINGELKQSLSLCNDILAAVDVHQITHHTVDIDFFYDQR